MGNNKKVLCPECQNWIELENDVLVGDVIECPQCGSSLRVTGFDADGNPTVVVIVEEK